MFKVKITGKQVRLFTIYDNIMSIIIARDLLIRISSFDSNFRMYQFSKNNVETIEFDYPGYNYYQRFGVSDEINSEERFSRE